MRWPGRNSCRTKRTEPDPDLLQVLLPAHQPADLGIVPGLLRADAVQKKNVPHGNSLHYGVRFKSALAQAYQSIGAKKGSGELAADQSIALSRKLNAAATSARGPLRLLRKLRPAYAGAIAENEQFGVFLWLRTLGSNREEEVLVDAGGQFAVCASRAVVGTM